MSKHPVQTNTDSLSLFSSEPSLPPTLFSSLLSFLSLFQSYKKCLCFSHLSSQPLSSREYICTVRLQQAATVIENITRSNSRRRARVSAKKETTILRQKRKLQSSKQQQHLLYSVVGVGFIRGIHFPSFLSFSFSLASLSSSSSFHLLMHGFRQPATGRDR